MQSRIRGCDQKESHPSPVSITTYQTEVPPELFSLFWGHFCLILFCRRGWPSPFPRYTNSCWSRQDKYRPYCNETSAKLSVYLFAHLIFVHLIKYGKETAYQCGRQQDHVQDWTYLRLHTQMVSWRSSTICDAGKDTCTTHDGGYDI